MSGLNISARSRLSEKRRSRFYSILVRLKVQLNPTISFLHEPFLFHAGSIKRETFERPRYSLLLFLFHTGSIKVRFGFRGASIGFQ